MAEVREQAVHCPYCGETISVLIDDSVPEQTYIEDCEVCCRPIVLAVAVDSDGDLEVVASADNE